MDLRSIEYPERTDSEFDLVVAICANGAGHHKRVYGALDLVLQARPDLRTAIFADRKVTERFMNDFEPLQRVAENPNILFVFGVVSNGLDIMAKDPQVYTDGRWMNWVDRLTPYKDIIQKSKLWADALPQMLMFRPDVMFSSSFTLGPVILDRWGKRDDELGRMARLYAQQEELLMKAFLPAYCVVKMFAMDFMYERSRVKELGVMADFDPLPKTETNPPSIGVSGGLTGLAGEVIGSAIELILQSGKYTLFLDKDMREKFPSALPLGNDAAAYAPLSACIIRPGLGSSTNCITSATPIIAISEPDLEMNSNGKRIQHYGLGIQIKKAEEVLVALESILTPDWKEHYASCHEKVSLNGLQELADEVIARL